MRGVNTGHYADALARAHGNGQCVRVKLSPVVCADTDGLVQTGSSTLVCRGQCDGSVNLAFHPSGRAVQKWVLSSVGRAADS
jgi:hypothetical protein